MSSAIDRSEASLSSAAVTTNRLVPSAPATDSIGA